MNPIDQPDQSFSLRLEQFAQPYMTTLAHQFDHIERVRKWALEIARAEGFKPLVLVEAAALLHDIGLRDGGTQRHAEVGAELAAHFLSHETALSRDDQAQIVYAIRMHSSLEGSGRLLDILQDADMLELFGAVGLARAFVSRSTWPLHDPAEIKGTTWGMSADDFTGRFKSGVGIGSHIIDQINFQISCFDNLHTDFARQIAAPMVAFMKLYLYQFESELA